MKQLCISILALLFAISGQSQGVITFANADPLLHSDASTRLTPPYVAGLMAGPSPNNLSFIATTPFLSGALSGYFEGGSQVITNVAPFYTVYVRMVVWNTNAGATLAQAQASLLTDAWGQTDVFSMATGDPSQFPPMLPASGMATFHWEPPFGTLIFKNLNSSPPLNAPVYGMDGQKLSGSRYQAGLVAGPNANELALVATAPFLTGGAAGYFSGGTVSVPGVPAGGTALVQVVAWDTSNGESFFDVMAAAGLYDASRRFSVVTGGAGEPPTTPSFLIGLTSFGFELGGPRPSAPPLFISRTANTLEFSWPFVVDLFSIQQSSDPRGNSWITLTNLSTFSGTRNRIVLPMPTQTMFFRLRSRNSNMF